MQDESLPDGIDIFLKSIEPMTEFIEELHKMSKKAQKDPKYAKMLNDKISETNGDAKSFDMILKELEAEVFLWKRLVDRRETLDITQKLIISELLKYRNTRSVAKMAGVTPKWLKSKNFNKNGEIELAKKLTEELLTRATGKKFDFSKWFKKFLDEDEKTRH